MQRIPKSGVWCFECRKTITFDKVDGHKHDLSPTFPKKEGNMKIPDGVRLCEKVPDAECNQCKLTTAHHTVNMSFPFEYSHGIAYHKICLKDWAKYKIKEAKVMAREELKISIIIKGDKIFMGVQATDCDPKMLTMKGDLPAALTRVPSFVAESNAAWDISARNPKTVEPVVVSTPAPARVATTAGHSVSKTAVAAPPAKPKIQPNFF
jgi:hypothetical protein